MSDLAASATTSSCRQSDTGLSGCRCSELRQKHTSPSSTAYQLQKVNCGIVIFMVWPHPWSRGPQFALATAMSTSISTDAATRVPNKVENDLVRTITTHTCQLQKSYQHHYGVWGSSYFSEFQVAVISHTFMFKEGRNPKTIQSTAATSGPELLLRYYLTFNIKEFSKLKTKKSCGIIRSIK